MTENVRLADLKAGDRVVADDGFDCMGPGEKTVCADAHGELYVPCREGQHYLSGQLETDGTLVGLTPASGEA